MGVTPSQMGNFCYIIDDMKENKTENPWLTFSTDQVDRNVIFSNDVVTKTKRFSVEMWVGGLLIVALAMWSKLLIPDYSFYRWLSSIFIE